MWKTQCAVAVEYIVPISAVTAIKGERRKVEGTGDAECAKPTV